MSICLLLHFYQPSNQLGDVIKEITQKSYIPLIKLIKNDKRIKITANFPLSLISHLEQFGYEYLIKDIKDLVAAGRIELVGSAAYHPLLTKIPKEFVERQIILNELAQGYYFGSSKDFEGESCYMIKDLRGFFPPEMALNLSVLEEIFKLGYDWVIADEFCLPKDVRERHRSGTCYRINNQTPRLIIRDRALTNMLSFKRNLINDEIVRELTKNNDTKVLALDAETFGHHFSDGIYLFESILSDIHAKGFITETVTEAFSGQDSVHIPAVNESTWSTLDESSVYPLWEVPSNPLNKALWDLYKCVHAESIEGLNDSGENGDSFVPTAFWSSESSKSDPILNFLKLEQSDQFWWSTGIELAGKINLSKYMVTSVLEYYKVVALAGKGNPILSEYIAQVESCG